MKKFYITCGDHQFMCGAVTPIQACLFMFYKYFSIGNHIKTMGTMFRVSERGYDKHDDDNNWETADIVSIALLNNEHKNKEEQECEQ